MRERIQHPSVENQTISHIQALGIKFVAFDLDNTLVDIYPIFDTAFTDSCGLLLFGSNWDNDNPNMQESARKLKGYADSYYCELKNTRGVYAALRNEFQVNPVISPYSVQIVGTQFLRLDPNHPHLELAIARINQIYTHDVPKVFPGAIDAVEIFNRAGAETAVATHREKDWMLHTRNNSPLVGKFKSWNNFDVDIPKSVQWAGFFENKGIDPKNALIIGDNFYEDIVSPWRLGAYVVYIGNNFENLDAEIKNSSRFTQISGLIDIHEAIANMRQQIVCGGDGTLHEL